MPETTLLVLAAGLGRRFGGLKQLQPVGPSGETLMEYSIHDALRAGYDRVVVVVRGETHAEFVETIGHRVSPHIPIEFAIQALDDLPDGRPAITDRTRPWGTGHAVLAGRHCVTRTGGRCTAINADDFYGAHAFEAVRTGGDGVVSIAGYRLRDTLPDHGAVSRALCTTDSEGRLQSLDEVPAIERDGDEGCYLDADGQSRRVPGSTLVSMNLCNFPVGLIAMLEELFLEFLRRDGQSADSEFMLPTAIDTLRSRRHVHARVVEVEGPWCGMTHAEDRDRTRTHIARLIDQGHYPRELWRRR